MSELNVTEVLNAIERFIKQRIKLDPRDYGVSMDGYRAYRSEARAITKDRTRAMEALQIAWAIEPRPEVLKDAFRAFSGRLQWFDICEECADQKESVCKRHDYGSTKAHLTYTTGQYFPTEYRKAAASVLETYIAGCKQAEAAAKPRTFTYATIADVKAANAAIGGHWFDRSTIRFFNTRIESCLLANDQFITSERMDENHPRLYTVRVACPDGSIDTVGEFQGHQTLEAAKLAARVRA